MNAADCFYGITAMNESNFKLAFVGSHGVGKTTLCYDLAARLKRREYSLDIVREVARRCPLPINEDTTVAAQQWILHSQIAEEVLASSQHQVVICDRSILDNYVYLLLSSGAQDFLEPLVDHWLVSYDLLVHVPVLEKPNPDGLRATDPLFQKAVEDRLVREIAARSPNLLTLHGLDRKQWIDTVEFAVLERLRPAQLELL
jgi:nicotinamide riboside kinase